MLKCIGAPCQLADEDDRQLCTCNPAIMITVTYTGCAKAPEDVVGISTCAKLVPLACDESGTHTADGNVARSLMMPRLIPASQSISI